MPEPRPFGESGGPVSFLPGVPTMRLDPAALLARLSRLLAAARPALRRTIAALQRLADLLDRLAGDGAPRT